jgi:uncharacterized protein YecT (DUF1311 family)
MKVLFFLFMGVFAFGQTNAEMKEQANKRFANADKELNVVYKQLMTEVKSNRKHQQKIISAQRIWLQFRDLHCECESQKHEGGSLESLIYTECLTELTLLRIKDLKALKTY